jgi:anti-sigma regulatory factor (Ser/Thr protein kinase)
MIGTPHLRRTSLAPVPQNARAARKFVRDCLLADHVNTDVDLVVLLVSELATNAIRHAGSIFDVWVEVLLPCVRVGVDDPSPVIPAPRAADNTALGGRGLALIEAMADRWGAETTSGGKRIWFEICR